MLCLKILFGNKFNCVKKYLLKRSVFSVMSVFTIQVINDAINNILKKWLGFYVVLTL